MALSKNEAIKLARDFVAKCAEKHDIRRAYLFGSFAREAVTRHSDIDLAIVIGSTHEFEDTPYNEDFEIFHEAQKYNSLLEVVCFPEHDFEMSGSSLVKRIKHDGIMIMENETNRKTADPCA